MLPKLETVRCSGSKYVHPLDPVPQLALFLEVHAITFVVALDEDAEEAENRNCKLSFVGGRENGLIAKSRDSWPTFK
jgi:hypothetical protein